MNLLVGNIKQLGAASSDLWQLNAPAPAPVELNTTNGANALEAVLPSDNSFKLFLTDVFLPGVKVVGALVLGAAYNVYNMLIDYGAGVIVQIGIESTGTPEKNTMFLDITGTQNDIVDVTGNFVFSESILSVGRNESFQDVANDLQNQISEDATGTTRNVDNNTTGKRITNNHTSTNFGVASYLSGNANGGNLNVSENGATLGAYLAGAHKVTAGVTGDHFYVSDVTGLNITFLIENTGAIQTNQVAASVAVRAKVGEMPIYDVSGALLGYIEIKQ